MRTRQSTMSKPLAIVYILALFAIASNAQIQEYDDTGPTALASTGDGGGGGSGGSGSSSNSTSSSDSSSGLISGILKIPETILSVVISPLTGILKLVVSPFADILEFVLKPVTHIVDAILEIVVSPLNLLGGGLSGVLSGVFKVVSLIISNISGILGSLLGGVSIQQISKRRRRGIMDSIIGMLMRMTLFLPFHFVRSILDLFSSAFGTLYDIIAWPLHLVFGDNDSGDLASEYTLSTSSQSLFTDLSSFVHGIVSSFLLNLSESSQEVLFDLLRRGWSVTKSYILPELDAFIVWAVHSGWVPDDIATMLESIHTAYTWIHLFGLV